MSVRAAGPANSAGSQASGADVESGHPGVGKKGAPELEGEIEVVVGGFTAGSADIEGVLKEAGARSVGQR
ncbi:conserved hypothetical protein; putative signal peptide [Bradyrhizobium sp. ORS 278]|nr:conserved hypothetical protein; putative signal peptide [Bradyrhizobium sp. ORS 278]